MHDSKYEELRAETNAGMQEKPRQSPFIASGLGITAHFLAINHLLRAHENKTARIRRLTLLWFLETRDQFAWAKEYLLALHEKDGERQITNMFFFYPRREDASDQVDALVEREWGSTRQVYPLSINLDVE